MQGGIVEAAVLAPVYRDGDGRLRLVLIRRGPRGVHGGQLALPGGRREPGDTDLCETALREAQEEIGLERARVEVVAALPIVTTATTGFHIAPFLGRLLGPPTPWRRQELEIAEVLEVDIEALAASHGQEEMLFGGWAAPRMVPFYRVGEHKLWGATYRIVQPLLPRLLGGELSV